MPTEKPEPFLETEVAFRPAEKGDLDFIFNSWLESFRASWEFKEVNGRDYWPGMRGVINRILQRTRCTIAHNPADPEQILGWACIELGPVIHYIYVKGPFRKKGLAKMMLRGLKALRDKYPGEELRHSFRQKTPGAERLVEWLRSHYSPFSR